MSGDPTADSWLQRITSALGCRRRAERLRVGTGCRDALDGWVSRNSAGGVAWPGADERRDYDHGDRSRRTRCARNIIAAQYDTLLPAIIAKNPEYQVQQRQQLDLGGASAPEPRDVRAGFARAAEALLNAEVAKAGLQSAAERGVSSALLMGTGWLKCSYYPDQTTRLHADRNAAAEALAKIEVQLEQLRRADGLAPASDGAQESAPTGDDLERLREETMRQIAALDARVATDDTGLCIEAVPFADVVLPKGMHSLRDYQLSPWMAQSKELTRTLYEARFGELPKGATWLGEGAEQRVKIWEIWCRKTQHVYWLCDGAEQYSGEPVPVSGSSRFYPFFLLPWRYVDSVISDSEKIDPYPRGAVEDWLDEQERIDHKARKEREFVNGYRAAMIVNGSSVDNLSAKKIANAVDLELIAVNLSDSPTNGAFTAYPNPPFRSEIYDYRSNVQALDQISGVSDFQRGAVVRAKTLGEAELIQESSNTRQSHRVATFEAALSELGQYALRLLVTHMSLEEVVTVIGAQAVQVWPQAMDPEAMMRMLDISVIAGSSGKPNKAAAAKRLLDITQAQQSFLQQAMLAMQQGQFQMAMAARNMFGELLYRVDETLALETIWPAASVQPPPAPSPASLPPALGAPPQAAAAANPGMEQIL